MFKGDAIGIIEEKTDKNIIFDNLKELSEQKTFKEKMLTPKKISIFCFSLCSLLLINYFFIHNIFLNGLSGVIVLTFLFSLIPLFVIASVEALDYLFFDSKKSKTKKFYSNEKIEKELSKHYSLNNKINEYLNKPLSLKTYQYLATVMKEDELKQIASLNLTYKDLDMENYYKLKNPTVKNLEKELKDIENKNKQKEEELLQIERDKEKAKK